MNISKIDFSIDTNSINIFCSGCKPPYCKDCFNPELWDFTIGEEYSAVHLNKIEYYLENFSHLITRIFLVGGSWNHQVEIETPVQQIAILCKKYSKDLYLFTREELNEVQKVFLEYCESIKIGAYIPELTTSDNIQYGVKLATSNQFITKKGIEF